MKRLFSVFIPALIIIASTSLSQNAPQSYKWKAPLITLEVTGMFNVPTGTARGSVTDFFTFTNFGCNLGIGFNVNAKIALNKKRNILALISAGFEQIEGDDYDNVYINGQNFNGYPLRDTMTFSTITGGGTSRVLIRNITAGIGIEYVFSPQKPVSPFVSADFNINNFFGYYTEDRNTGGYIYYKINKAVRYGAELNAGVELRIKNNIGFIVGAKYHIANIIGRKSEATNDNTFNLLDAAATGLNSRLTNDRIISIFQPYLGFSAFLGFRK